MVRFPHASNRIIDDELFLAMWKHIVELYGEAGINPAEASIPRMNQAVDYDVLLKKVPKICLEVICRLLMRDSYLNTMMATNPFLQANSHLLESTRVINPKTGKTVNGVKLTDLAKNKIKIINPDKMAHAISLTKVDAHYGKTNTIIEPVEKKNRPSCGDFSDYDFIRFIVNKLKNHSEPSYIWQYKIKSHANWLPSDLKQSNNLEAAGHILSIAGRKMHEAMTSNNELLCYECVEVIMDWGGVYYPTGPRKGNKETVEKLYTSGLLLKRIVDNYKHLQSRDVKNVNLMNAGWTKVWAVLCPDDFVIFDSRVSFAFSKLLKEYCDLSCPQKDNSGNYNFANDLGYRQIKQSHRDVAGFKAVNANAAHWASSMLLVSDILKSCLAYANVIGVDICRYSPKNLRSLEARLFVMGK